MEWMITGSSGGSMEEELETRLRGACPASDKGRKKAAAEVSRVFQATCFSRWGAWSQST